MVDIRDTAGLIVNAIKIAVKKFGEYNLHDKGLGEVADTNAMCDWLTALSGEQAGEALLVVFYHAQIVDVARESVTYLIGCLDDQPEDWFNDLIKNPILAELY